MRKTIGLWLALALPGLAHAADPTDKPIIAPPAPWVVPAKLPAEMPKADEAAIRLILSDQQVRLTKDGADVYNESLVRVQTPQGLQLLGNLTLPWKPDTSTLTVHRLRILRGATVIDLLKDGPGFTVLRRENKLEYATLDGVLTAVIQPEGLQVGDLVDIATTTSTHDPVLAGHPEGSLGGWSNLPIAHVSSRALWDSSLPVRWRATDLTPAVRERKAGGMTEISLSADQLDPVLYPKDAPPRFRLPRLVEATTFAAWSDVATLFAPLYRQAATITPGSPLAAEVARIAAASSDPTKRAEAALALVQDRVRYVFLGLNDGGLKPASAEITWQRRFGDCKGKTVLLLAMLHALGIDAEPALVSTTFGDGLDQRLPMVALFDHVLVRATIATGIQWLDGTRVGDRRLADLVVPPFRWALPVRPSGAMLERLVQQPAARPFGASEVRIDATAGISRPAPMHAETVLRGDVATQLKINLANLTPEQRDQGLRDFWTHRYDFLTVKTASARYDDATGEEHLVMDGTAIMDWSPSYEPDGVGVGWTADFARPPGPHRDAPYAVPFPTYDRTSETVLLPNHGAGFAIDTPDVDQTVASIEYHRKARLKGGTYTVELTTRSVAPEFPASEADKDQTILRALTKQRVFLNKTVAYRTTGEERAVILASSPKTAADFYARAAAYFQGGNMPAAIADYTRAIELKSDDAGVFAWRGTAHANLGELNAADADYGRALALDPAFPEARLGRARLALARRRPLDAREQIDKLLASDAGNADALAIRIMADHALADKAAVNADLTALGRKAPPLRAAAVTNDIGDHDGAIGMLTRLLAAEPENVEARAFRASILQGIGMDQQALADNDLLIKEAPHEVNFYLQRANILMHMGRGVEIARVAADVVAANPANDYAHIVAASIYTHAGRPADAASQFDRAIQLKPTVSAYLTRANNRPEDDVAGRRADVDAALRLEPDNREAQMMLLGAAWRAKDYAGVIAIASAMRAKWPELTGPPMYRGLAQLKLDHAAQAEADFVAARAAVTDPQQLNYMCWFKATHDVALESALADCDAGLALSRQDAPLIDSRAFVLFRLGRYQDAIAGYDAALSIRPKLAASLYGRGLAKRKSGHVAEGEADIAAARAADAGVAKVFAGYGVS